MGEPEGESPRQNVPVFTASYDGARGRVYVPFRGGTERFVTGNVNPIPEERMNKTTRTNRFRSLASRYRPRAPEPLEQVIRVLVRRQEKLNALVKQGRRVPNRLVSATIDGLVADTCLTRKQVRDALETLREAELIRFERQHNGRRGWGRAFYDCQALVYEVRKPPPDYRRLMAEADYEEYLEDRAREQENTGGWGVPRYDEEVRREVEEALREARADAQATRYEEDLALEVLADNFLAAVEYIRAEWGLRDAREQAQYDGMTEEEAEAIALEREDYLAHLVTDGLALAWLGIPGYREALDAHFPNLFEKVMSYGAAGTPEAETILRA